MRVAFELRDATEEDYDLLWRIQRASIGPYVDSTWGWDEEFQRRYFDEHFDHRNFEIIRVRGADVGFLSFERRAEFVYLGNVALLPDFQRQGIGGEVVRSVVGQADELGLPVRLQVLKTNPARSFYERLGFALCGETETHFQMIRDREYFHGYSPEEQRRLVRQADYWRKSLIPLGLAFGPGERVLEIGCAAGATLGALASEFPGIQLAGVDREPRQIEFARDHLAVLGLEADLRVADARELPWEAERFDHVYIMWLLEHVADPVPILTEARRVLRPGGTITLTETDYTSFKVHPPSRDYDYLEEAQYAFFARFGNPIAGRLLGSLLGAAGFADVRSAPVGFHFFSGEGAIALRAHVEYVAEFLEPGLEKMAGLLGRDAERLRRGLDHLRSIPKHADGSMTQIVYRASGRK